jgi:hypothetical protein
MVLSFLFLSEDDSKNFRGDAFTAPQVGGGHSLNPAYPV